MAFVIAPFALVLSPGGDELAFSMTADDSAFWPWHAVAAVLTAGAAWVTGLAGRERWTAVVSNPTGLPDTLTADQVGVDLHVPA